MEALEEAELCFSQLNTSCRKTMNSHWVATLLFSLLCCITVVIVVLNLLVIISISHFRQLHTTTNLLLLSLAVSDFLVGLLQMPSEFLLFRGCWILGDLICGVNYFFGYLIVSVSVGNMVLISIDRYVAICDPMFYNTKVTLRRIQLCICLCWIFSAVHSTWILRDFLKQHHLYDSCYGECLFISNFVEEIVDLVVTFLGPILIIILLYLRVFVVAVSQARAMRSHIAAVTLQRSENVKAKRSEMKAARTLGVVVVVFLLCSCPYYCVAIAAVNNSIWESSAAIEIWLLYFNSCLNPVIYVFFYPWFRKSIKHIITLQILQPGSSEANLM
ncbi:trace amine-associated receptor 13c-like [Seriola lalandi dorsalis]|uniref:trace amine-associated receptor 13c-like n=1 Tax=Seriola lalandi dorsalis TaxID=1841481 RepID=UPI000C6F806B|nr:trace amine-associated receptor 13c-like [Seriola lalandi dorsalis]XP_056246163.1 trace amine-associated receptor 13c-like [Seriola aureovittata]